LQELLESDDKFGFIVMDGEGRVRGRVSVRVRVRVRVRLRLRRDGWSHL
jgi:hypothetical protein